MTLDYSRNIPGAVIGGAHNGFQQADMSAQKEALYRQTLNANTCGQEMPTPPRGSEEIISVIAQRLQFTDELARRLNALTDRACGATPQCGAEGGKVGPAPPECLATKLHLTLLAIEQLNARVCDSVQRLESFV